MNNLKMISKLIEPQKEPIVPYGPFVMNTEEEIYQALADLRAGTFVK